ncbi:YncE family protein [Rhodopseudomonas sp.]|uniref:YncE family protein n=1 Tax=Rhodopseudomonas sp. TaxID=1078 RepID=UPI003B3BD7CB
MPQILAPTRRRLLAWSTFGLAALACPRTGCAVQTDADGLRTIFVARRGSNTLSAIDITTDTPTTPLDLGLEPHALQISQRGGRLAAIDQRSSAVAVADIATRSSRTIALPLLPSRLRISPDGKRLALFDDARGTILLLDGDGREASLIRAAPGIREAIFSGDSATLFVVGGAQAGVTAYDAADGRPSQPIAAPRLDALLRAPNGREGFALSADAPRTIFHFDLQRRSVITSVPSPDAAELFATGTGVQLLALGRSGEGFYILPAEPLRLGVTLSAAAGSSIAYSAWSDTVAFVPDEKSRRLLIFDLERGKAAGSIALGGVPGAGVVTPNGDKLYLPLEDTGAVAIIDTHLRQRTASIAIGQAPTQAIIAGGYGLCH